jgi:SAM-dependent methyltransferase
MDEVAKYNTERWEALVRANALFTRPALHLSTESARQRVDRDGRLGNVAGKDVLCLASGGGQQGPAFALLGARVTVADLSAGQLERDRTAAAHYKVDIRTVQADMRDLSALETSSFDLVWQPYSLNFVPDCRPVFAEVARVLRSGGIYHLQCANPFVAGLGTKDWNGKGFVLNRPYVNGEEITYSDEDWVYDRAKAPAAPIDGPREYRQTLSTIVNALVASGLGITHFSDSLDIEPDPSAEPGTWGHFCAVAPPWLAFWCRRSA